MRHKDVPSLTVWFVLPGTMTLFTDKGCGESRVVHGHRVAQHPLVAVGDSDKNVQISSVTNRRHHWQNHLVEFTFLGD